MMVAKISTEHKEETDKLEDQFTNEINQLNLNEKKLKNKLETANTDVNELKKKLHEETTQRVKL